MSGQCPATTRYASPGTGDITGLQCKYAPGHDGDHAASPPGGGPDTFWPRGDTTVIVRTSQRAADEEHIRKLLAVAMDHPGQFVYGA